MNSDEQYYNILETLVSIFTVDKGILKVLLVRKKTEPYKGYWLLPGSFVSREETLEESMSHTIEMELGLKDISLTQGKTFSDLMRNHEQRVIATSYVGLIDMISFDLKRIPNVELEISWFSVSDIPKMAYDHDHILKENLLLLKKNLDELMVLKQLFPSDFTLPELHKVCEQILEKELDRRNFRKKIIHSGLIEDTKDQYESGNGRPAKLYRFKDTI